LQEPDTIEKSREIEDLLDRAINGDGNAFGRLYDMHVDRVYRHIGYRVSDHADAEDLTQQVFIKAWQAMGRYRRTAVPFPGWLIKISHNTVIDYYRSRKPETHIDLDFVDTKTDRNPERMAEAQFERERIRLGIRQLHNDQQQVITMRLIDDFSFADIAASLGKSEGAVRVILHRGLVKLKAILDRGQR